MIMSNYVDTLEKKRLVVYSYLTHAFHRYLLCDSTYLLEQAVRLHLLTGVIR